MLQTSVKMACTYMHRYVAHKWASCLARPNSCHVACRAVWHGHLIARGHLQQQSRSQAGNSGGRQESHRFLQQSRHSKKNTMQPSRHSDWGWRCTWASCSSSWLALSLKRSLWLHRTLTMVWPPSSAPHSPLCPVTTHHWSDEVTNTLCTMRSHMALAVCAASYKRDLGKSWVSIEPGKDPLAHSCKKFAIRCWQAYVAVRQCVLW